MKLLSFNPAMTFKMVISVTCMCCSGHLVDLYMMLSYFTSTRISCLSIKVPYCTGSFELTVHLHKMKTV